MGASRPRVSVLVAARDAERWLGAALESVRRQVFGDWECVVVDDGSRIVVGEQRDARFRVIRTEGVGAAEARNRGLCVCRGEFVAVLDADDCMHRARLAAQVAALDAHPSWAAVGCRVRYMPTGALGEGMRRYERWLNGIRTPDQVRREGWIEMSVGHPTLMVRADVLRELGGWRARGWPEDYDLFLRLVMERGSDVGVVPRRLLAWRVRAASLSRTSDAYSIESFTRCRAAFLASVFLRDRDDYVLWGHGPTGRQLARALHEHGKRPSHIVEVHPRRIGREIHGAPVISPDALGDPGDTPGRPLIAAVSGLEARGLIRARLTELGWIEGRDFVCAA